MAGQGKHIVVVGGGFLGSELAIALSKRGNDKGGIKVTQVFPESGNMGLVFPKYLMDWASKKIHKLGVVTIPNTQIDNAETKDSSVCLKLTNGSEILADHVVVAIGIDPNVELAKRAGLEIDEKRGGILVNAELEARTGVFVF